MKKALFTFFAVFTMAVAFAQTQDSVVVFQPSGEFNVTPYGNYLVFSSMDWYKTVFCYSEDGRKMFRYNVQRKAKHQISQLVTECYSNWDNGYYIVGVKNGKKQKLCDFHKDNGMVVLVIDNDYIEK